jgi:hypothetical protein
VCDESIRNFINRVPERFGPEPASTESSQSRSVSNGRLPTVRVAHRHFAAGSRQALPVSPTRHKLAGASPPTEFSERTGRSVALPCFARLVRTVRD